MAMRIAFVGNFIVAVTLLLSATRLQTRHEPAGPLHVSPIVVTESGDEILLFFPGADYEQQERQAVYEEKLRREFKP